MTHDRSRWGIRLAFATYLLVSGTASFSAEDNRYALQTGDEVKITVFKEPDMSGLFKVGMTGLISIPGVGEIKSEGLTPDELRESVIQALAKRHYANPSVTVDVSQYGPVYIMGDVRNPGRQAYIPGLTVLQLVAVAGGYPLPIGVAENGTSTRELDRYKDELATACEMMASQTIRRARLLAERDGQDEIPPLPSLDGMIGKDRLDQMRASETQLMKARSGEVAQRTEMLRRQSLELESGRSALEGQLAATQRLKGIVDTELRNIRELKERGLTANARVLELERISADTEMRINNGLSLISQANQDRVGIELQIKQAAENAKIKVAEELISTEAELASAARRIASAAQFLNASGAVIPKGLSVEVDMPRQFTIVRKGTAAPFKVSEMAMLRPGDVLTIMRGTTSLPIGIASGTAGDQVTSRQPISN